MAKFLRPHTNGSYIAQIFVPEDIREAFGGRQNRVRYIPCMSERDATDKAMAFAVESKALFKLLKARKAAGETLPNLTLADTLPALDFYATLPRIDPEDAIRNAPKGSRLANYDSGKLALEFIRADKRTAAVHAEAKAAAALLIDPAYDWRALFKRWQSRTGSTYVAEHERTLDLLNKILGNRDTRTVMHDDIETFLEALPKHVESVAMQRKIRFQLSGMFRECVPAWRKDNPVSGSKVIGKHDAIKTLTFSGAEIAKLRATAIRINYHDEHNADALWVMDIQTFMGCRVNEAAQLQAGDIVEHHGVPSVWFRAIDAGAAGKRVNHPCKKIKTGDERLVPLHPALWNDKHPRFDKKRGSIVTLAERKGNALGAFLFGFDRYQRDGKPKPKGGAQWMIQNGHVLLEQAGLKAPAGHAYKPNHSYRHRVNAAMKTAGGIWASDDERKAFLGHASSVNSGYGDLDADLYKGRGAALWNVDPLA